MTIWKNKTRKFGLLLTTSLILTAPMVGDSFAADNNCSVDASGDYSCPDANNAATAAVSTTTESTAESIATTATQDAINAATAGTSSLPGVTIIPSAESIATADSLDQSITDIVAELDPELKSSLSNAISSAITTLGEVLKEQIRQGKIDKKQAEGDLRKLVQKIIDEANKIDEATLAEAQKANDEQAMKDLQEQSVRQRDEYAQNLYDFINAKVTDPDAILPTAADTAGTNGRQTIAPVWDVKGNADGKIAVFVDPQGNHSKRKSMYKSTSEMDYKAQKGDVDYVFRQHGKNDRPNMDGNLYIVLDELQSLLESERGGYKDVKFSIVSGYRSPAYNRRLRERGVKAAKNSQHMKYTAGDMKPMGISQKTGTIDLIPIGLVFSAACKVINNHGKGGNGWYPDFTHIDVRSKRAAWPGKKDDPNSRAAKCKRQK